MASTQHFHLGQAAGRLDDGLARFASEGFLDRLWRQDAGLWSADSTAQASIRQRLGWLTIVETMAPQAEALARFAGEIREAGVRRVLVLGMGGSGLFPEVCRAVFGVAAGCPDLAVLDTTDPTAIRASHTRESLPQLLIVVSSKSGSTVEVSALSGYFYEALRSVHADPGSRCVAITDAGTRLEAQAARQGFRAKFVHGPGTGAEVGGRFSALTYFGLVPAALIGVDVAELLQRAIAMRALCAPEVPLPRHPAAQLAAAVGMLVEDGLDKLTVLAAPPLAGFGAWLEQLIAENLGKSGRGIIPILGEPLLVPGDYSRDRVFIELQLASEIDERLERQARLLIDAGRPVIRIQWEDRYDLGQEVMKWCVASAMIGGLMRINPFDEPDVQESKDRTRALLEGYAREGRLGEPDRPTCSSGELDLYGLQGAEAASLPACLAGFFERLRPRDYIALLSFLPRTPELDRLLQALRGRIAQRFGQATMLGFGPRYLHSTGQLYKGGPDNGLFLLLTSDERQDLAIPGEPFTFGVLKRAQAAGDVQAMRERGRRILRLHLRGEPARALERLAGALEEALAS